MYIFFFFSNFLHPLTYKDARSFLSAILIFLKCHTIHSLTIQVTVFSVSAPKEREIGIMWITWELDRASIHHLSPSLSGPWGSILSSDGRLPLPGNLILLVTTQAWDHEVWGEDLDQPINQQFCFHTQLCLYQNLPVHLRWFADNCDGAGMRISTFLQVKKPLIGSQGSKILRLNSFSAKAAISPPPLSCTTKGGFMRICVTMRSWFRWSEVKQQTKLTTYSPVMLLYSEVFVFCFCEIVMSSLRNEG